ncbi:MAG TPA: peptidylprolyl isomerase [Chloroflexia bacterium]|nr:peptidylprolyl isomerase [Chloroflexia bacterium]
MAKKKKLQSTAPVMTRGQLSRAAREKRRIRNLYTAAIAVGTIVVLVIGYAVINTFILRPNAEVAKVGDVTITRDTYNKIRRYNLYTSINNTAFFQEQTGQTTIGTGTGTVEELMTQLRNANNDPILDADTINQLVDNEVLRQQSASEFAINPSRDELKAAQIKDFIPQPTPPTTSPTPEPPSTPSPDVTSTATSTSSVTPPTSTPTSTPTAGSPTNTSTPTATLPPVPGGQQTAEAYYPRFVKALDMGTSPSQTEPICRYGCPDISEDDLLKLIVDPKVRREQVIEKLAATQVMTEVAQIRAQQIVTDTKAAAENIKARLDKGEDFTKVANEQSKEQIDRINTGLPSTGGETGWFPKEGSETVADKDFAAKALELTEKPGEISQPFQVGEKWYIVKVLERDEKRPREQSQIDSLKQTAYDDWFKKTKDAYTTSNRIKTGLPVLPSIPTVPAIPEPTTAPIQQTPQGPQGPPGPPTPITGTTTITSTIPVSGTNGTTPVQTPPQATPPANPSATSPPTQ